MNMKMRQYPHSYGLQLLPTGFLRDLLFLCASALGVGNNMERKTGKHIQPSGLHSFPAGFLRDLFFLCASVLGVDKSSA